jgi:hypothetical protein
VKELSIGEGWINILVIHDVTQGFSCISESNENNDGSVRYTQINL